MTENTVGTHETTDRHEASRSSGTQFRVLVVEDDQTSRDELLAMLNKLGYRADLVVNGAEAVEALNQESYRCGLTAKDDNEQSSSLTCRNCVVPSESHDFR
jgi:PleD family two-component response regulator